MRGLSPAVASGGHSSSRCAGLSLSRPLLLRSTGSRRADSVIVAHGPSCSAACGIFPDQGSNRVPCIGRQILNHCATREARETFLKWESSMGKQKFISCELSEDIFLLPNLSLCPSACKMCLFTLQGCCSSKTDKGRVFIMICTPSSGSCELFGSLTLRSMGRDV